ncbi:MAG: suppressor of fused domain protein, partial [Streptosporangiaceae bacterium]
MAKTRARPGQPEPETLVESTSPYESRRMVVEYDGITTAAYLNDDSTAVAAAWIANHRPAPATTDLGRLNSGRAPVMPVAHTKHPGGRPPLDPRGLSVLWFEEGDGAAVLENGQLLAVIPGWADMAKGMPGYSRDVIGQTPFSWSLDDAIEGLGPRVAAAAEFWRWRAQPAAWASFQQAVLG